MKARQESPDDFVFDRTWVKLDGFFPQEFRELLQVTPVGADGLPGIASLERQVPQEQARLIFDGAVFFSERIRASLTQQSAGILQAFFVGSKGVRPPE